MRKFLPVLVLLALAIPCAAQQQVNGRVALNVLMNAQIVPATGNRFRITFPSNATNVYYIFGPRGQSTNITFQESSVLPNETDPAYSPQASLQNLNCTQNPDTTAPVTALTFAQFVPANGFAIFLCPIPTTNKADVAITADQNSSPFDFFAFVQAGPQAWTPVIASGANGQPIQVSSTGVVATSGGGAACGGTADTAAPAILCVMAGVDTAGNVQELPVADTNTASPAQVLQVGGTNGTNTFAFAVATGTTGVLASGMSLAGVDGQANNAGMGFAINNGANPSPAIVWPSSFNGATWDRQFYCNLTKFVTGVINTTTGIVAGVAGQKIRVCTVVIERNDVTGVATTLKFVEGTGANCGAAQTPLTANLFTSGATAVTTDSPPAVINNSASGPFVTNVVADTLCVQTTGAASSFDVTITEAQY